MKTAEGIVIETDGVIAKVKTGRHAECKDCGACPGTESPIITTRNALNATVGQRVLFELKEDNQLKGAFLIFVLPLIMFFAGIFLGGMAADYFSINTLLGRVAGGFFLFILSAIFVKLFDKHVSKSTSALPAIVKIVK